MRLGCLRLRMMREFAEEPQADNITVNSISPISLGSLLYVHGFILLNGNPRTARLRLRQALRVISGGQVCALAA